MKKILLSLLLTLMGLSLVANPVDPDKAIQVAKRFAMLQVKITDSSAAIVYTHTMPNSGSPAIYAVNVGGSAFVLVAADDIAHPVLGYSMSRPWPTGSADGSSAFPRGEQMVLPSQVTAFLDDLASQIEAARQQAIAPDRDIASEWSIYLSGSSPMLGEGDPQGGGVCQTPSSSLPDSVGPLLTTTWDQGQYYNALCPEDANGPAGRVPTGCVATAMAQIINYWGYPVHGRGIHSYNHPTYGTLTVNYDSANYDYAHMPNILTSTSTQQEINAVATLMRDCGVAANMDYGLTESGASIYNLYSVLINNFGFSENMGFGLRNLYRDTTWNNLIRSNINDSNPIIYSGSSDYSNHCFVLDGYKSNDYYHFNFGWSGFGDGWYKLTAINPSLDFSLDQRAIMNIYPDSNSQTFVGNDGINTFIIVDNVDFYNTFGKNRMRIPATIESHNDTLIFISDDDSSQLVVDFMSYEDETLAVYDGTTTDSLLRQISVDSTNNDFSPIVSTQNAVTIINTFNLNPEGFHLRISKNTSCRMVSNIEATVDSANVNLSWVENGTATAWKVEYGQEGFSMGEGMSVVAQSNNITIPYNNPNTIIEFRIQPLCDSADNNVINSMVINKERYWKDVVTEEPEGYYVDSSGTFFISSAEGLAWLAKKVNEFHSGDMWHTGGDGLLDYDISIEADIDLSGHIWEPINYWYGNFYGNGHVISNMKIHSSGYEAAFFWSFHGDTIRDIGFKNAYVSGIEVATIAAGTSNNMVAVNCYSEDYILYATSCYAGGLFREANGTLLNCYAYGQQYSSLADGGLVGVGAPSLKNCYASIQSNDGVLCGSTLGGSSYNCYAEIDSITALQNSTSELLCFFGAYAVTGTLRNIAAFSRLGGAFAHTIPNVSNNYQYGGSVDLLYALNHGLVEINSPELRIWEWDSVMGLPQYSDAYYVVTCPNVSSITASNIPYGNGFAVALSWQENGFANEWQIKCLPYGVVDEDSAMFFTSYDTTFNLTGLTLAKRYDIYVRPVCGANDPVVWGTPLSFWVDKAYWVDVVTSCPEGYVEDVNGNVTISSSEGLAWLSVCSNRLNNQARNTYEGKTITITSDIDMGAYRWTPISKIELRDSMFRGSFNGNGHSISNIYCREDDDYLGLFGHMYQATIRNVNVLYSSVEGLTRIGALFGEAFESIIDNCHIKNAVVRGNEFCGCLGGTIESFGNLCIMRNSSSSGIVNGNHQIGGLVGFNTTSSHVSNCFSIANVVSQEYGYKGGLIGGADGTVLNGYFAGSVSSQVPNFVGSALGVLYPDYCTVKNVYGIRQDSVPLLGYTEWGTPVISDTASFSSFGILETPITINGENYFVLLSALNAWVDANDTAGIYRHWAADSANVNGGYPVFAAIPCPVINVHDTIAACENYTWNGTLYNSSIVVTDTLSTLNGCDSIVTLHLTVNNPVHTATTETACETFTWNNTAYTTSGNYTFSHLDINGCTQVDTLHLTINNPVHTAMTETACESYTWNNTAYTTSGNYTFSHIDANGCTQVDTLHLTINNPVHTATTETVCESYTWNNTAYTTSGNYTFSHLDANGCTQVDTLHLTINNPVHTASTETACETYTWNNTAYTTSGNYTFSHLDVNGCTQVDTLHLTINNPVHTASTETACETYTWNNTAYTTSGNYTFSHLDVNGCTQVDTLHLTINYSTTGDTTAVACDSFTWWNTNYTNSTNTPTHTYTNVAGCDSVVTLHLTINYSVETTVSETAEGSYTWNGETYTESGTYQWHGTTVDGCDSTVTLMLTINTVGIDEIENSKFEIDIYPNPTTGMLTIEGDGVVRVEVMDMLGRVTIDRTLSQWEGTLTIDLSNMPQGSYVLRIITCDGSIIRRVMKR